ncbi:Type I restriction-modification system DNA methylase [Neisseria elongata]|uniref:Type I restriction-modification system DNA methylase n=1 Tax=Neisseria elongata TaxID=495 RepID=A0A378U113_NEIEL|nr:restriction endonuclease subunit S [Neisseria elongata]SFG90343.1 type I restriction enzyme, S subunit [Neisseria elongata subsp. elongata]STZ68042.1 Type I restriction-modification system DNA methylase [Neisseria elongata]
MSEWATYTISEVCRRFSSGKGITASQIFEIGAYPVFGGNGIRGYTDTYNFEGECAIIGRQGAYCGNTKYFCGKAYMTEHAIVATANDEHNIGYIANLLSIMDLGQYQGQSAQPGLSVNTLSKIELKLPDKETQDSIFSLLFSLDKKIALNKQINARLEEMAKTLYDYWFVQFDFPDANGKPYKSSGGEMVFDETLKREIPKGWEVKSLGDWAEIRKGTLITEKTANTNGDIKVISAGVDFSYYHDVANRPKNTITISASGANAGFVNFWREPIFACDCTTITNSVIGRTLYILNFLKIVQDFIYQQARGSAQPHVYPKDIEGLKIIVPPDLLLKRFSEFVENWNLKIANNEKQNHHLTQLRDFLLSMLMNGQVSVAE